MGYPQSKSKGILRLRKKGYRQHGFMEGDIKACFDRISRKWLPDNVPMDKKILNQWLKAGFMEKGRLFPTEDGTPQGGIISPVLANFALDGLENKLKTAFRWQDKVNLIRYADDFIITGNTRELLEDKVEPLVKQHFGERGLELSEEKTHTRLYFFVTLR